MPDIKTYDLNKNISVAMKCEACNKSFNCSNSLNCWCSKMPKLIELTKGDSCYCSDCLTHLISRQYRSIKNIPANDIEIISKMGLPKSLIEGVDFNINAEGLYTFTSWYLLRRGYCCGNGCQNCPY